MPKKTAKTLLNQKVVNNKQKALLSKKEVKKNKILENKNKQQSEIEQNDDIKQNGLNQSNKSGSGSDSGSENSKSQQSQSNSNNDQNEDSQDQESQSQLAPENYAIKQMKFREKRGTKMNYLMSRKKQEQEDSFWQNQGQDYFGTLENQQEDQDYEQSSSGRDQFDSDFDQTQSKHSDGQNKQEEVIVDQDKLKQKKKQHELMKQIGARLDKKSTLKTNASANKKNYSDKKPAPEITNRYIHQVCTQQQLLGQAAQTQYINWISLQKLIEYENEKKDFIAREHYLQGNKIIYRDKIDDNGKRHSSYQLVGVEITEVQDLTRYMNQQSEYQ